jgi:thioesterase domain-containing protein/acyl carrier protein
MGDRPVPIGRPIQNCQLYVLDHAQQPVPVGVSGELYIGGIGLARGYLHRPDLTAASFVPSPFYIDKDAGGARLYRTGDLARWLPDGSLEYLGRRDHQLKIRGFRVELGEIEAALVQQASVREAVVLARPAGPAGPRLVAYLVADGDPPPSGVALRAALKQQLPEYMLPAAFVFLPSLPLTPNGKLDRKALPDPEPARPAMPAEATAPRTDTEARLVRIWTQVLHLDQVGIHDNFFDLGGSSLMAAQLVNHLREALGVDLPLRRLFEGPTVAELAAGLDQADHHGKPEASWSPLVEIQPRGSRLPFFCVAPVGGQVFCYFPLAERLGAQQPFYGLQSSNEVAAGTTIEEMAAVNVAAIRRHQPQGPYQVGGWSFGGLIAFEMARQLKAQGAEVALLALIDTHLPSAVRDGAFDPVRNSYLALLSLFSATQAARLRDRLGPLEGLRAMAPDQRLAHIRDAAVGTGVLPQETTVEWLRMMQAGYQARQEAALRYVPRRYLGPIVLLRAAQSDPPEGAAPGDAMVAEDQAYGWGALSTETVVVHPVTGTHESLVREPDVADLASRLRAYLHSSPDLTRQI